MRVATALPVAEAPVPSTETIALTERGSKMLALIRTHEAQPGAWPWLAAQLDRRIAALLDN